MFQALKWVSLFSFLPQVVAGVLVQEKEWEIRSVEGIKAATALLFHKQPTDVLRVELDGSTSTELKPLLGAVKATGYEGKLRLTPLHSHDKKQQQKGTK